MLFCLQTWSSVFLSENKDLREVLPPLIEKGIDCIELHAMGDNDDEVYENGVISTRFMTAF